MRLIEKSREAMWRTVEWSFVMGCLSWLLVRMWTDSVYDRNHRKRRLPSRKWARPTREPKARADSDVTEPGHVG
jgi:hypothetical protein